MSRAMKTFRPAEEIDFTVIGSGAAGGVLAMELSEAGFNVVVLEQGPFVDPRDFDHDEMAHMFDQRFIGGSKGEFPQTFRQSEDVEALVKDLPPPLLYARMVGGSSVHFTANYWRLREIDFNERSVLGPIEGTGFADWPITYADLEPYYTKVDWKIGVSGVAGPTDAYRSKPYPMPPIPVKSSGVLFEKGANKLGWSPQPAPMAILSQAYQGRPACIHCGHCILFGCEVNAKSSTLAAAIPQAIETGRCEIRADSTVVRIDTNASGKANRVVYLDKDGLEHAQNSKAVIVAANGAETPRLLLMSESARHPNGLANSSGKVGKYLMFNASPSSWGVFDEPLNEFKSAQVTRILLDFYNTDPARGFYGGGGMDARFMGIGPMYYALNGMAPDVPKWGKGFKDALANDFTRTMTVMAHTTSLAQESNNISLDPKVKDKWGRPAIRVTYHDHKDDLATMTFLTDRARDLLDAAGAKKYWTDPIKPQDLAAHLLGTCRMGDEGESSVVDKFHRSHDVSNLFICDGSSMVTSGRGQPTMTIQALAFRAAEHISEFAKRGDLG